MLEAIEELKEYFCQSLISSTDIITAMAHYRELKSKSKALLNALNKQKFHSSKMSKDATYEDVDDTNVGDIKGDITEEKPASIWKPVSEKPQYSAQVIVCRELNGQLGWPKKYDYAFAEYKQQWSGKYEIKGWYDIGANAEDGGKRFIDQDNGYYCLLTDFIQDTERTKSELAELKAKVDKLMEGKITM